MPCAVAQKFVGTKCCFIVHAGEVFDPVAQVEMLDIATGTEMVQGEDIQSAWTAPAEFRVKVKIDRIEPGRATVDHGHTQQPIINPVADFKTAADTGDKKTGIITFRQATTGWKTLGKKPLQQVQVLAGHGQGSDLDRNILIFTPDPALIAVRPQPLWPQSYRYTEATLRATHVIDAVTVAAVAVGKEFSHALLIEPTGHPLMIDGSLIQAIRALGNNVDKESLHASRDPQRHIMVRTLPLVQMHNILRNIRYL